MEKPDKLNRTCAAILIALMALLLIQASFTPSLPAANAQTPDNQNPTGAASDFSVIWITDTQYLSEKYPTYFDALCRWIVNNAEAYNVKMVVHTGDLVDTEGNLTQWANANNSMGLLLDAGIPYCWDAGNHDYNATCWIGNRFTAFNTTVMEQEPYWVSSDFNGQNTAAHFNVSGWDFLFVNVAYNANDSVLSWANNLLDSNPQSYAVVATHFYVNRTGGYESWATNFRSKVLDTHPNVFLTLSGHVYPLAYSGLRTQVGGRNELVFNRQDKDGEMGGASLRILTFNTENGTIGVKTYVLYANQFLSDSNNQFTLSTTFRNDAASGDIPELPSNLIFSVLIVIVVSALLYVKKSFAKRIFPAF
jgi:hypothetical protein